MDEVENWRQWRTLREERLREPHGLLAVIGTHWLGSEPAPILEGEPVLWSAGPDGRTVMVTAKAEHGLFVDGEPIDGTVTLRVDTAEDPQRVTAPDYGILLVPIERDGGAALRVHDTKSATLEAFAGIDAFEYDPAWVVEAIFTPYEASRTEMVLNTDGVVRGLGLDGAVDFELADGAHSLQASVTVTGGLRIVFADPAIAQPKPSFRFLDTSAIAEDGSVRLDFNRAYLPPSVFTDHDACPMPPRGNVLDLPVRAGEFAVRTR